MAKALVRGDANRIGPLRPFSRMPLPRGLAIPRWLGALLAVAAAVGPLVERSDRRRSRARKVLRAIQLSSTLTYFVTVAVDSAEHFRLERQVTGRWLRWVAVPLSESAIHAALLAINVSALVLARPIRRPLGVRDGWVLVAPAVFLAVGWLDELVYHRRRAPHREQIVHAVEHLAEGMMWTALYAERLATPALEPRSSRRQNAPAPTAPAR